MHPAAFTWEETMSASSNRPEDPIVFEGEEAGAGYASPALDLIAAAFLIALSVLVMIASAALPVPGSVLTAPGLLPFLVAGSLAAMAVGLGLAALQRRRAGFVSGPPRDRATDLRTFGLAIAVAIYIAALEHLAFRHDVVVGGLRHTLSAFEPVSVIALAAIIWAFWRGPLWIIATVSAGWIAFLSIVFQHLFVIPLPGGF